MIEVYLDIETTGLSCQYAKITVIGIYRVSNISAELVQLVGRDASANNLLEAVRGIDSLYTYNGSRFDLPFINNLLGVNLELLAKHHDLMYDCWQYNLFGGFKEVERRLSIPRRLNGVTGLDAVLLWQRYEEQGDQSALDLLLEYNKEDVVNLKALRDRLAEKFG